MKLALVVSLAAFVGCGYPGDPCGLDCLSGTCYCYPHKWSTDQFWVSVSPGYTVEFWNCDCEVTRAVAGTGRPIPSDPARQECFARVAGVWDPGRDCHMSDGENGTYDACYRVVEWGGAVACGSP